MMIRKPAVAGRFYPGVTSKLLSQLKELLSPDLEREKVIGCVSPHAGYVYSGKLAGELYSKIFITDSVVILGPNHTGYGKGVSIFPEGFWETPIGRVKINPLLSSMIEARCPMVEKDAQAHLFEHSIEVQIPFLQYVKDNIQIVPITLSHLSLEECQIVGKAISASIRELGEDILVIASSDMNHYENQRITEKKDKLAIEKILALDARGLLDVTSQHGVSMCGVIPTSVMLIAALELGAKKARLLRHATSGDITGGYDKVVGYASLVVC